MKRPPAKYRSLEPEKGAGASSVTESSSENIQQRNTIDLGPVSRVHCTVDITIERDELWHVLRDSEAGETLEHFNVVSHSEDNHASCGANITKQIATTRIRLSPMIHGFNLALKWKVRCMLWHSFLVISQRSGHRIEKPRRGHTRPPIACRRFIYGNSQRGPSIACSHRNFPLGLIICLQHHLPATELDRGT